MKRYLSLNNDKSPKTTFDQTHESIERLEAAGVLLNENTLIVDFDGDNKNEQSIINYLKAKYPTETVVTKRGVHFYYSKPVEVDIKNVSDTVTLGGFQVDYKIGSKSYAVVKLDGKVRLGAEDLTLDDLPTLPLICRPLKGAKNVTGLVDGSGRNNALFFHLMRMKEHFPYIERRDVAEFVNVLCFDEAIDAGEVSNILQSVDKTQSKPSAHELIGFAKHFSKEINLTLYKDSLYFKVNNQYFSDDTRLKRAVNKQMPLKKHQYSEVLHQFNTYSDLVNDDRFHINCRNISLQDGEIKEPVISFTPFYLDIDYNPDVYDEHVDRFLNEVTRDRKELRKTLEEVLGHCLMTEGFPHKAFFLYGAGRNGKSTFLEMINAFVGDLKSNVALADFEDQTFLVSMIGKLVNCSDDTNMELIKHSRNFKSITAGNTMDVREVYARPIKFKNTATIIINANDLPAFADKSRGLFERIFVIPFDLQLTDDKIDPFLLEKLTTETAKSYILNLAISGMRTLREKGSMSHNIYTEGALASYKEATDTLGAFFDINPIEDGSWFNDVYLRYSAYCVHIDKNPESKIKLGKRLRNMGFTTETKRNPHKADPTNRERIINKL